MTDIRNPLGLSSAGTLARLPNASADLLGTTYLAQDVLPAPGRLFYCVATPGDTFAWEVISGSAPVVTGDPNSILFEDPAGASSITDPALVAGPIDVFGRPQIWDHRQAAGVGSVLREGAWQQDGDPTSQAAEGAVFYGANALGLGPSAAQGGYARVKPRRFGLAQIIPGINGGALFYAIRLDTDAENGIRMNDDANAQQLKIDRLTGTISFGSDVAPVGAPGSARFFGNAPGTLHGSNAGMQYSSLIANRAQLRANAYGAHTGVPGVTGFKSRAANIGGLAAVAPGDVLWRATAIGVCADNASVPLSGLLSFNAKTVAAARIGCDLEVQQSPSTAAQRITWVFEGETGNLVGSVGIVRETINGAAIGLVPAVITYKPGAVAPLPAGMVNTWADLMRVFNGTSGPVTIAIDSSLGVTVIPAGAHDLQGRAIIVPAGTTFQSLDVTDGAQLRNIRKVDGNGQMLQISCHGTVLHSLGFDTATSAFEVTGGALLLRFGPIPMIQQAAGDQILMLFSNGAYSGPGLCDTPAGAFLTIQAFSGSFHEAGAFTGAGTVAYNWDPSVILSTNAGCAGFTPQPVMGGILKGRQTLAAGTSPAITAPGLQGSSTIHVDFLRPVPGAGNLTNSLFAPVGDRILGSAGSFKIRAALADGTVNVLDTSDVEWTITF